MAALYQELYREKWFRNLIIIVMTINLLFAFSFVKHKCHF